MKVESTTTLTCIEVEFDNGTIARRWAGGYWSILMGESWEPVNDPERLERAYRDWVFI